VFRPLPRTDHHTRAVQASSHLAGALSEGGGGNAKGGGGGGKRLLDASGELEAVSLHGDRGLGGAELHAAAHGGRREGGGSRGEREEDEGPGLHLDFHLLMKYSRMFGS